MNQLINKHVKRLCQQTDRIIAPNRIMGGYINPTMILLSLLHRTLIDSLQAEEIQQMTGATAVDTTPGQIVINNPRPIPPDIIEGEFSVVKPDEVSIMDLIALHINENPSPSPSQRPITAVRLSQEKPHGKQHPL